MRGPRRFVQHRPTAEQAQLLKRHGRGLRRLADALSAKNGLRPEDIAFVLADAAGRIGEALRAALPVASVDPVVLPGRAAELSAWLERLALHGPVWDLSGAIIGFPVIVVDEHDAMGLVRLVEQSS